MRIADKTSPYPNVTSAVTQGSRGRRYSKRIKKDVAKYIAERSNSLQGMGVVLAWLSRIKKLAKTIFPAWQEHKKKAERQIVFSAMPDSGPGSYYVLMFEFANKHWPNFL